jgi:outer membrane protein assembly factor BamB
VADASSSTPSLGIPAISGTSVIVCGPGPTLEAYTLLGGKPLWQRTLPEDPAVSPGTPLVMASRVLLVNGTTLTAFDLHAGTLLWEKKVPGLHVAGTPLQAATGGVLVPADDVPIFNPATGESWPATEPLLLMAWEDAQAARSPEAGNRHGGTQAGMPRVERLVSETGVWAPS